MARRRKGQPIHGWLIIDKPAGMTSTDVVNRVRRRLDAQKVGHGGTLDPMATGILPLAFGEATKTVSYVMDGQKTYRFGLTWGAATTTDDSEGEVIATSDKRPTTEEINDALKGFIGLIDQVPPAFSAIKIDGQRAYDLAREGEAVEMKSRQVRIDRVALVEQPDENTAFFDVDCGKGTYIRSLARDLGEVLGTRAHVCALRRLQVGPFTEEGAISLDYLEELAQGAPAQELLLPIQTALDDIPALALSETEATRLRSGQALSMIARSNAERIRNLENGDLLCAMCGDKPVAISRFEGGEVRPVRVLNL
ncbi:tRNA pseudouridine(55) synthase TruB [Rhodovibrionaceae bacterium A322]